jgi:hypothetical protein
MSDISQSLSHNLAKDEGLEEIANIGMKRRMRYLASNPP